MTTILSNIGLNQADTGSQTATIAEPSLACSGQRLFVTGNWFASRSTNGGKSWSFVDPYTVFPPAGPEFCCDQLIHYSSKWKLWIWLLQFSKNASGNRVRVAVSATGASGTWTFWDTTPQDIDPTWQGFWLDYPDLMETDNHLMLSFNLFTINSDRWQRAVVLRLPLATLKARGQLTRQAWSTSECGSLRFARGPGNAAWFASLSDTTPQIEVFQWADSKTTVNRSSIAVTDWDDNNYVSPLPDGGAWLSRLDDRITGGWKSDHSIGFAWSAAADAEHPHPFVRVVRIDQRTLTLLDEPDLWSSDRAWAYPAMSPNLRGDVGISVFSGGGGHFPTHCVGCLNEATGVWEMAVAAASTHSPQNGVWGDYVDIQPDQTRRTCWWASGFVLQGGSTRNHITPKVVEFKR